MNKKNRNLKQYCQLFGIGFTMGTADVVPGVSGGTMAFILGIYSELLTSISCITSRKTWQFLFGGQIKQAWKAINGNFLVVLGLGILCAVVTISHLLEHLLESRPILVWSFFFGLVAASILVVRRRVKAWSGARILYFIFAAIITFIIFSSAPQATPDVWWFYILCGAIAIFAMILPGISGSYLLILLGKYDTILAAVNNRDVLTIALVGIGAIIGLLGFSRLVSYVLNKYHDATIAVLAGCMLGSLQRIWPWSVATSSSEPSIFIYGLIALGAAIIFIVDRPIKNQIT